MNREIKFRAWNGNRMILEPRVLEGDLNDLIKEWQENKALMQYTGLKDEDGVEIYEGDIMEWHIGENNINIARQEVKFNVETQTIILFINNTSKVIGNIYQNQELLK